MRPKQISEVLMILLKAQKPVLLKGPPGVGKTDMVRQACAALDMDLIVSHPVVDDPIDYKGVPFVVKEHAEFLPIGHLRKIISTKEPTVFFLDDLGQAPPTVQAAAMQLLLARRINEHAVSDKVTFVAATNRKQDKAGVTGILEPVKSRFATILEVEPNADDWLQWAIKNDMPPQLIGFINYRRELLHKFEPSSDITNSPCPRTVAYVGDLIKMNFPNELRMEVFKGAAGEGFASELVAFLRVYEGLPDPKEILKDPSKLKMDQMENKHDKMYALAAALADIVTGKFMENFVKILDKIPAEYGVMAMNMATSGRNRTEILTSQSFSVWIKKNKDLLY